MIKVKKIIADSNIFLRFLLQDIPQQAEKAEKLLRDVKAGRKQVYVPQIIIFEIAYALEKFYSFPKDRVIDALESIFAFEKLEIQDGDLLKTALKLYQDNNLDITDCFLISLKNEFGGEIVTFDKKLEKIKI